MTKYDNRKFNYAFIGPKKTAFLKLIDGAKTGCRLAVNIDDARNLSSWADKWVRAKACYRVVNSVDVFARQCDDFDDVIKEFTSRGQRGSDDYKAACEIITTMLKGYRDGLKGGEDGH